MSSIRIITLDLDNTLWDVDRTIIQAEADMKTWMSEHAPGVLQNYQPEVVTDIRTRLLSDPAAKRHDLTHMRLRVLNELAIYSGYSSAQAEEMAQGAFAVFFEGRNRVEFFPGAIAMLEEVSTHFPVYALTNGNADIHKAGIGEYLSGAYSSADLGTSKPDPKMFVTPLKELGYKPAEAVHVGDNLVDDIHGANEAGLASLWVNLRGYDRQEHDAQPDAEVSQLAQVYKAIEGIAER